MRATTKILLLSLVMLLSITIGYTLAWQKQKNNFATVEKAEIEEFGEIFREIVTLKSAALQSYVFDNTYWDEMVSFVQSPDEEWAQTNIIESMSAQKFDYVAILDTQKKIIFYHQISDAIPPIDTKVTRALFNPEKPLFLNYFLSIDGTVIEVFLAPIQPSNDIKRNTKPEGFYIAGRILSEEYIKNFEKITKQTVEIVNNNTDKKYNFLFPLYSDEKIPIEHLGVKVQSKTITIVNEILEIQLNTMFIASFIIFLFISLGVYLIVIKPLQNISKILQKKNLKALPEYLNKNDEFGDMAKSIQSLFEAVELQSNIFDNAGFCLIRTDKDGLIKQVNKATETLLGYSSEELVDKYTPEIIHFLPEIEQKARELSEEFHTILLPSFEVLVIKSDKGLENEYVWTYISKKGEHIPVHLRVAALRGNEGNIYGYLGIAVDIREKEKNHLLEKLSHELLEKNETLNSYISIVDKNTIVFSADIDGKITYVSEAFSQRSGYSKEELLGKHYVILKSDILSDVMFAAMKQNVRSNVTWRGEVENISKNGACYWLDMAISPIFDKHGTRIGFTSISQDITDKKHVEELSITDGLTHIYNRRYFDEVAPKIISRAKRKNEQVCFLFIDVDNFKHYNDCSGHQKGDEVLIACAKVLEDSLKRADDYSFRLGGEEFGVILNVDNQEQALAYAEKIRKSIEALAIHHEYNEVSSYVTVSIGLVCEKASDILNTEEMYKKADELLYVAKRNGKNQIALKQNL